MTTSRHGLKPARVYQGLRIARTADEAFRTATYADAFERHIPPPFWARVVLFFRRNFA